VSKRPFAAFDIDGTVIRWQLYHALADDLARHGQFDPKQFEQVRHARMQWKKRTHATSFREYELALVTLFETVISEISVEDLLAACHRVMDEYKDQVYTYTRDLILELKAKNYLLFAISGSQQEIVKLLADYYGFDDFGGTIYEVKDGRFTGERTILRSERKPVSLQQMIEKHGASTDGSVAVGDSDSDIPLLAAVEQPIAFNPSKELFEHARAQAWPVVIERKNMIYRLEPKDGGYILA
jgi:HAD superfamily hydrolase (TIGR01490 family)